MNENASWNTPTHRVIHYSLASVSRNEDMWNSYDKRLNLPPLPWPLSRQEAWIYFIRTTLTRRRIFLMRSAYRIVWVWVRICTSVSESERACIFMCVREILKIRWKQLCAYVCTFGYVSTLNKRIFKCMISGLSVCLSVCLSLSLSVSLSVNLSLSVSVSVCLSVCLSLSLSNVCYCFNVVFLMILKTSLIWLMRKDN